MLREPARLDRRSQWPRLATTDASALIQLNEAPEIEMSQPTPRTVPTVAVVTKYGRLAGLQLDRHQAFRGSPFAQPPIGPRRLRPAEPRLPRSGVRAATKAERAVSDTFLPTRN